MPGLIAKRRIYKALNSNTRTHVFRNVDTMKNILILFTYRDWPEIEHIVKELEEDCKNVILWTILPRNTKVFDFNIPSQVNLIKAKEYSSLFGLSKSAIAEFNKQVTKCDTLIDLTVDESDAVLFLLANNVAEFCIGIKESEYKLYDFTLVREKDKSITETFGQIKNYLNNIR